MKTHDLARALVASLSRLPQPVFIYLPAWPVIDRVRYALQEAFAWTTQCGLAQWEPPTYNELRVLVSAPRAAQWYDPVVDVVVRVGLRGAS